MDLRKNVPVVPVQNGNPPSPVKGAKKAFLQLIGGLVTVMFLLFHFGMGNSKTPPNNQPPQRVAETNIQSPQPQQQIPDVHSKSNKPQQKPAEAVFQNNKPVAQPQPKPAVQPQVKPTAPRVSNVNAGSSSGKAMNWLKTAGKLGLGIITKGKVKIR